MSDTPTPTLLSAERLAEIREVRAVAAQLHTRLSQPDAASLDLPQNETADYYATIAFDLLAHLDAREAAFTEALKGLLWKPDVLSQLEPADHVKMQMRNNEVRRTAASLGLDLTT